MRQVVTVKVLSAIALAVVLLGQVSPVAIEMLLCIGDGQDPDCCAEGQALPGSRIDASSGLAHGSDCDCCITVPAVTAVAAMAASSHHPVSVEFVAESARVRDEMALERTSVRRLPAGSTGAASLGALRTVVLLI